MPITIRQVIRRSLLLLGVISAAEPLEATEAQDGLDTLNALVASWGTERLFLSHIPRVDVPLVPGQGTYPWGPGGVIASPRPLRLTGAVLRVEQMDWPVAVLSQTEYEQGVTLKGLESTYPCSVYYETSYPLGVLHVFVVPQMPYTLGLFPVVPLHGFASIDATVTLPEGYERLLVYGLAAEMSVMFGKEISPSVAAVLAEAKSAIKRTNAVTPVLRCDAALTGQGPRGAPDWTAIYAGDR
jgi:hypothetical protein